MITNTVYIGLGSNVGSKLLYLAEARKHIRQDLGRIVKTSSIFTSKPQGFTSKHDFLNQVVCLKTKASAHEALKCLQAIEQRMGRLKKSQLRYSDRSIDLDLLYFNSDCINDTDLTLPHPRISERAFVLKPLMQLCSAFVDPIRFKTVFQLYQKCPNKNAVKLYSNGTPKLISIMGPIGSGKSHLAALISSLSQSKFMHEQHADNALLLKFYKGQQTTALKMEKWFLKQHKLHFNSNVFKAHDTMFVSDYFVDQNLIYAKCNLNKTQLRQFKNDFNKVKALCQVPDIKIILLCKPLTAYKRIQKRKQAGDRDIDINYLNRLYALWIQHLKSNTHGVNMCFDTTALNKSQMRLLAKSILKTIHELLN
jgi:deoxyguanosine kinase